MASLDQVTVAAGAPRPPGPTALGARLLGPDLARGGMLLLIALANVHAFAYGFVPGFRGYPTEQSVLDRILVFAQMVLVDGRAFPLFAALFGYGLVQLAQRRGEHGCAGDTVRLLRRRGWWLIAIGVAHAMLLFTGDIVALYGLVGVAISAAVVRGTDRHLLVVAAWLAVPALAFGAVRGLPASTLGHVEAVTATPVVFDGALLEDLGTRCAEWIIGIGRVLGLAPAVLLGAWAARKRALSSPQAHRRTLRWTAASGLTLGVAGGVPAAMMAAGLWAEPSTATSLTAGLLHLASGYAVAAAYIAFFALGAAHLARPVGPVARAVAATGQRSLTFYLGQSVLFLLILDPAFVGLGNRISIWLAGLIATGVWVAGLLTAAVLDRGGVRGPAETFLRWATYQRR
ncbi:MAG TPA: DUF418 domain-containing protein [Pilimelia sp.]|nr:DUF418 domain-containing protein [Pilimelia sp.]